MANQTITYSEAAQGFPSFYSYYPDWMIGMNDHFYTFSGGNLYRHNVNADRNTFYGEYTPSTLRGVFNDQPLENKQFKTISLEGNDSWSALLQTDIQDSGFIEAAWFQKKEQSWYAFVRNSGTVPAGVGEYALRSLNGIGRSSVVTFDTGIAVINFAVTISIGNILSVGDMFYFSEPPYDTPVLAGQITLIEVDLRRGVNRITIDTTIPDTTPIPIQDAFYLYVKNAISESHGVLGHYCVFDITNDSTEEVELFSVRSEVMKSYP